MLHNVMLRHIALQYVALQCVTFCYIVLQFGTFNVFVCMICFIAFLFCKFSFVFCSCLLLFALCLLAPTLAHTPHVKTNSVAQPA